MGLAQARPNYKHACIVESTIKIVSQATPFIWGGRVWSNSHHDFVPRSVQLACAKVGANSNLIVAAVIRDVVMKCTYTVRHTCIAHMAGYALAHRAHGHINTSSLVAPTCRRLTRQENRGMQVRRRDASLTRPFLPV